jgi:hypothetical protein
LHSQEILILFWYYPCADSFVSKNRNSTNKKWSADVAKHSDALDLEKGVFTLNDPKKIAESLKQSAKYSHRRKGTPFQSAMSMLNPHCSKNVYFQQISSIFRWAKY